MTTIRAHAEQYLAMRRALGYQLHSQGRLLLDFADQMDRAGHKHITIATALAWATQTSAGAATRRLRLSVIRCFARHMAALDPAHQVPPNGLLPGGKSRPIPYLYSAEEISALVRAAESLTVPINAATYQALISLLAVTGLRIKEALGLRRVDVDLDGGVLHVTGKYGKPRLVPIHPTTAAMLRSYAARRDQLVPLPQADTFFIASTGRPLHHAIARRTFWDLLKRAGITAPPSRNRPRLHDLRHGFAVATYLRWYHDGVDVAANAPVLSAYLGHRCPSDTYWYLSAAPELLELAAQRLRPLEERS